MLFVFWNRNRNTLAPHSDEIVSEKSIYALDTSKKSLDELTVELLALRRSLEGLQSLLSHEVEDVGSVADVLKDLQRHKHFEMARNLRHYLQLNKHVNHYSYSQGLASLGIYNSRTDFEAVTFTALNKALLKIDDLNQNIELLAAKGGRYVSFAKLIEAKLELLDSLKFYLSDPYVIEEVHKRMLQLVGDLYSRSKLLDIVLSPDSIFQEGMTEIDEIINGFKFDLQSSFVNVSINDANRLLFRRIILDVIKSAPYRTFDGNALPMLLNVLKPEEVVKLNLEIGPSEDFFLEFNKVLDCYLPDLVLSKVAKAFEENLYLYDTSVILKVVSLVAKSPYYDKFVKSSPVFLLANFSQQKKDFFKEFHNNLEKRQILPYLIVYIDMIPEDQLNMVIKYTQEHGYNVYFHLINFFETKGHFNNKTYIDFKNKYFARLLINDVNQTKDFSLFKDLDIVTFLKFLLLDSDAYYTSTFEKLFEMVLRRKNFEDALNHFFQINPFLFHKIIENAFNYGMLDSIIRKIDKRGNVFALIVYVFMSKTLNRDFASVAAFIELVDLLPAKNKRLHLYLILKKLKSFDDLKMHRFGDKALFKKLSNEDFKYLRTLIDGALMNEYSSDVIIDADEYFDSNNEFVQVQAYYDDWRGDRDGHRSLQSFVRTYGYSIKFDEDGLFVSTRQFRKKPNITLDDSRASEGFLVLNEYNPSNGRKVVMYLTLPRVIDESEGSELVIIDDNTFVTGANSLRDYLAVNNIRPRQIVHRGHSPYSRQTFKDFPLDNVLSVVNGGCGRYIETSRLVVDNPNIHYFFATRSIGTGPINNLYLKFLNDLLIQSQGEVSLSILDKKIKAYFAKSPRLRKRFANYETFLFANNYTLQALKFLKGLET